MDNSLETYRSQLARNPDDLEALQALEAALLQAQDWQGLVDLTAERAEALDDDDRGAMWLRLAQGLEAYAESLEDPPAISKLATIIGDVVEMRLQAPDQAIGYYENAVQLDPQNVAAIHAARRLHTAAESWEGVFTLLNLEVATLGDPTAQADVYFEMATISRDRLERLSDAAACVRQATRLVPDHPRAAEFADLIEQQRDGRLGDVNALIAQADAARDPRQRAQLKVQAAGQWFEASPADEGIEALLKQVLAKSPRNEPARLLLEQYYEQNERLDELIAFLTARAEATSRKSDRIAIYQRLAALHAEQPAAAEPWHRKVLAINAVEPTSLNFCVDHYSANEEWRALVEVYEAALRVRHRGRDESAMLVQIAMTLWKKIGDLDAAETYFKRIKLNDPKNGLMLTFYREFYREKGDHKRLLQTLTAQQQAAQAPDDKIRVGLEMAQVAENDLGNLQKAIDVYKSILKIDRSHGPAREALRRLFTRAAKWNALLEFLKEDLKLTQAPDARRAIYRQIIEIYRDRMKLSRMVVSTWNQVLAESPGDPEALDALEAIYERRSAWNDLIEVLQQRADGAAEAGDVPGQVAQLRRIATLWLDKFGNPTRAVESFERIVEIEPTDAASLDALADLYRRRKDWPALQRTFERQLPLLEGEARVARLVEMAQMADERLKDPADAVERWQAVLADDPDHDAARDALESLFERHDHHEALIDLYRDRVARTDGAAQAPWLRKLARGLMDTLADVDGAADAWQTVLDLDPQDADAEGFLRDLYLGRGDWERLEKLFGGRGKWAEYASLLRDAADATDDPVARIDLLRRRAMVCADQLDDEPAAIAAWEAVLEADPDNLEAAQTLAPRYARDAQWDGLVKAKGIILAHEPADPVGLMVELAEVHADKRDDAGQAWQWYARALAAAPTRADLLDASVRTAAAADRQPQLGDLLGELVDRELPPADEVRLRTALAQLDTDALGRPTEAAAHHERIIELEGPKPAQLTALESLYQQLGRWDDLLRTYDQRLEQADTPADRTAILSAMGELHEGPRGDAEAASAIYEQVREIDPQNVAALRGLQRIAEQSDDPDALRGHLEAELTLVEAPAEQAALHHRLGQLAERTGDVDAAQDRYAQALEADASHPAAFEALKAQLDGPAAHRAADLLEPHLRAQDAWGDLRRVLSLRVDADAATREAALRERAEIEEQKLAEHAAAFETWQAVLIDAPGDEAVRGHLERLASQHDRQSDLSTHYAHFAVGGEHANDAELATLYSRRVADLQETELGDPAAARDTLEALAAEHGDDATTLDALDRLNQALEDWRGVAAVCERRLTIAEPSDQQAVLFRLGALWEDKLDDRSAAADAWRRVLADDANNAKAQAALERIFTQSEQFDALADLLSDRIDASEGPDRVTLTFQLAQVLETELERPLDALARYAEVLTADPDHEDAADAIEGLIIEHDEPEDAALRAEACDVLDPVYLHRNDWQSRIHIAQVRLGDADTPSRQAELQVQIARLYEEEAQDDRAAFASYGAALQATFGDQPIFDNLLRLAEKLGAWRDLNAYLRQGLEESTDLDPALRRQTLGRIAEIFVEKVKDPTEAIEIYKTILEDDPEDAEALAALDTLYQQVEDETALVDVLQRRIDLSDDVPHRIALSFRLGALYEQQPETLPQAVAAYARVRQEIDPSDLRAHAALERLYAQQDNHAELVEVLTDHADQVDDAEAQSSLLIRAAQTYEVGLEQPAQAVDLYRQVLDIKADDPETLGNLDRLLSDLDRPVELLEVLEAERDLAEDDAARTPFDHRIGMLLRDALGESERAVEAFKTVLDRDPAHAPARAALEGMLDDPAVRLDASTILTPLYANDGAWAPLRDTLQRVLDDHEPDAQVAALERIAQIEAQHLDNPRAAFDALREAWRRGEGPARLEPELERLADSQSAHADLADLYASGVDQAGERAEALYLKIAGLAEAQLDDPQRAIAQYLEVLAREPEHRGALDALERLYTRTENHAALADVLEQKVELIDSAEARKPLLVQVAELREIMLDDRDASIETWRRILADDETDTDALDNLERQLNAAERWPELAALLDHRVSVTKGDDRTAVEFRLAQVLERRLSEGERALDLYRRILAADPQHAGALDAMAALFWDRDGTEALGIPHEAVADALEPIYRADDDAANLAAVLDVQQAARVGEPDEQVRILRELATLHEQALRNADAAFDARGQVLQVAPEDAENRAALHRLAEQTNRFEDLATLIEGAAAETSDPELRVALLLSLGRLEEQHRGQDEKAVAVYREIIGIDPECTPAVTALVDVFTRRAAWDELVNLHLERAEGADDLEQRLALSFEACRILEDVMADTDRAIEVYREVLQHDPTNERAYTALHRIFTREDRFDDLADLLRDRVESVTEMPQRAALRYELGEVLETRLDDLDGAIAAWHTVLLDDAPGHEPAMEALERLLIELADEDDPQSGERRRRAAEILEPIYADSERWSDWILVQEVRLEFQSDRWQQVETLTAIAKAHEEHQRDDAAAFNAWRRAFALDYGNADIQSELDRLGEGLGAWDALVAAYADGIDTCDDPDTAAAIWTRIGTIRDRQLNQPQGAIEAFQQVLALDESNAGAMTALERLLGAAGDDAALVQVLQSKADLADDPDERQALRYRIARLTEDKLDQPDQVIETYRTIFEDDPSQRRAVDALVRLYGETGDWQTQVAMLREQYEMADEGEQRDILARIAQVQEQELDDVESTIMTWRSVLELQSTDVEGQAALERLLRAEGRWGELIDLLEDQREGADDDAATAIELKIAGILHTEMEQTEQAVALYGEVLDRDANAIAARAALEKLLEEPAHRLLSSRVLEPFYEKLNAHAALARIYEIQLLDIDEPVERLDLLKRLGDLQRDVLTHPKAAFDAYARALEVDPADETVLNALHALADAEGLHPELAQRYAERVKTVHDVPVAVDLNRRLARLYQHDLEVPAEAIAAWQAVIADEPYDAEALAALDTLHTAAENWDALIEVLRRRIDDGTAENLPDLQCKLGYLLQHVSGDPAAAIELHRAVLIDNPEHAESLRLMEELAAQIEYRAQVAEVLDPLYRDAEAWDRLALLTEMRIELVDAPRERAMLWMQSAELREEKLGLKPSAFEALLQAFDELPDDEDVRERLLRLGEAEGLHPQLVTAFTAVQDRVEHPDVQVDDQVRIARWCRDQLNTPDQAVQHFERALVLDPGNEIALDALEALHADRGNASALADVMRLRIDALFDLEVKRERLLTLGKLCEVQLGDSERAAEAYNEALELDDADTAALDALEALHTRTQDWSALADVLQQRVGVTYDDDALVTLHRRLGRLYQQELSLPPQAAEAFERVRELSGDDQEAIDALISLYEQTEDWDRLQDALLGDLALHEDEPTRAAQTLRRLAQNAEVNQQRPYAAVDYHRQVLGLAPADTAAMRALERLYGESDRWYDLVEAWRLHLDAIEDPTEQVALRIKIADVARTQLYDADLAIECLDAVLATEPEHGRALISLAQLHQQAGDWEKAVSSLQQVASTAPDASDRAAAFLAMGELYRDHLSQPQKAREAFESALAIEDLPAATEGLLAMARADGDDAAVLTLLTRKLQGVQGADRLPLLTELATLHGKQGAHAAAVPLLEEAQGLKPEDLKVSDALLDAYFAADRHADALPLLNAVIERLKAARRNREVFRYNYRLGCVAEAQGDDDRALAAYTACFEFDATFVPNLVRLAKLHYRREDWDKALKVYQTTLLHQMKLDKADRVDVFYHLGMVRIARGEARQAKSMFTRALSQDPGHAPSKQALAELAG